MKKIGLIPNIKRDEAFQVTKRLAQYCLEKGCIPQVEEEVGELAGLQEYIVSERAIYETSDFIISLGGDGTLLGIGRKACEYDTPILGINLGTLGYLTTEDKTHAERAIDAVLNGVYRLEKRILIRTFLKTQENEKEKIVALNDICITRGALSKILEFEIYINEEQIYSIRADGIILCTPTGSTAYNLSAGGPILKADGDMICITPIAPHTFLNRPMVVSAEDTIRIEFEITGMERELCFLSADGQQNWKLRGKQVIEVKKEENYVQIIKTCTQDFYDVLKEKLLK